MIPTPFTLDWRSQSECFPFEDENNYYITVESEYETPGDAKESRLAEAQRSGVFKLLKFYGKEAPQFPSHDHRQLNQNRL